MRMPTSENVQRASAAAKGLDLASQVRCPSDPSPDADAAGVSPAPVADVAGVSPVPGADVAVVGISQLHSADLFSYCSTAQRSVSLPSSLMWV